MSPDPAPGLGKRLTEAGGPAGDISLGVSRFVFGGSVVGVPHAPVFHSESMFIVDFVGVAV